MRVGWGVMAFLTAISLILAVPRNLARRRSYLLVILAAVLSFPALRNYADGNIDGLLLIGLLLLSYGYREEKPVLFGLGVLLVTIKPQASALLLLVLPVYLIQSKPFRFYLRAGIVVLAIALLSFLALQPAEWLRAMFGVTGANRTFGIALSAFLANLGVPAGVLWGLRAIIIVASIFIVVRPGNREISYLKIAMLVAGSLLAAPYSGGLTLVAIMAFGVIPLTLTRTPIGIALYVLYTVPFFAFGAAPDFWHQAYWTILLFASWALFAYLLLGTSADDEIGVPLTSPVSELSPSEGV
jgi:hypothetical protein